jgi:drug/metabolite transporter (DMT)-like permease
MSFRSSQTWNLESLKLFFLVPADRKNLHAFCYSRCAYMLPAQLHSSGFALGTVCCWGVSDFLGGYTARRFQPFFLACLGHFAGTVYVAALALSSHAPLPPESHLGWAALGGTCGGFALGLFYRALSQGSMGLAAPVSAVLSAAIPALFALFTRGAPRPIAVLGFAFALIGIWLISRPEDGGRAEGLGLAVIAGLGFAMFYIFMDRAGSGAALWLSTASRGAAFVVTAIVVVAGQKFSPTYAAGFGLALLAGCIDVSGTVLFIRAAQTGRLDTAVILSSLYPTITVLLARILLKEHFTRWKVLGVAAALAAVPLIAAG